MGLFDRLGGKLGDRISGFGDKLGGAVAGRERVLILDMAQLEKWPEQIARHQKLPENINVWLKEVEKRAARVHETKAKLTDPRLKEKKFPERAYQIYDEHLPRVRQEIEIVVKHADFSNNVFLVEQQVRSFQEALTAYHESTRKSITALKEFLAQELAEVNGAMRDLEDASIKVLTTLEQARFNNIKDLQKLIEEYIGTREKEQKLIALKQQLLQEIERFDAKKMKIKERIRIIAERAPNPRYKELIKEEEDLHTQEEELRFKSLPAEELEAALKPVQQRMLFLRKQMINDITALNINEQRGFLDSVKDDLLLAQRKLDRVNELLSDLRYEIYRQKFLAAIEPFKAKIEEANQIVEGDDIVSPQ